MIGRFWALMRSPVAAIAVGVIATGLIAALLIDWGGDRREADIRAEQTKRRNQAQEILADTEREIEDARNRIDPADATEWLLDLDRPAVQRSDDDRGPAIRE